MHAQPIEQLDSYEPKSPFLREIIDASAIPVTKKIAQQDIELDETATVKHRQHYVRLVNELKCLTGHRIVHTILGELESAQTNGEFLESMKQIETLIARVRQKLVEAQILIWSGDVF